MQHVIQDSSATRPSNSAHLAMLLGWLHRLLAWQIKVTQWKYGRLADDPYRGLHISDDESEQLQLPAAALPNELLLERDDLAIERTALEALEQQAEQAGEPLPLLRLARRFGLSPFERDVVLLALAPELDLSYERILTYIQDSVTKTRPTIDLVLRLLCLDADERLRARQAFSARAPLVRQRVLNLSGDGQSTPSRLTTVLRVDDRILDELLSYDAGTQADIAIDPLVAPYLSFGRTDRQLSDLLLPTALLVQLRRAISYANAGLVLSLQGGYGSGRKAIAEALCAEAGHPLLLVDLHFMIMRNLDAIEATQRTMREALLRDAALLYLGGDQVFHDPALGLWRQALLAALKEYPGCSFLSVERPWQPQGTIGSSRFLHIEIPDLSYSAREQMWRLRLGADRPDDMALRALASTFRLSGGQIRDAVALARSLADWQAADNHSEAPITALYAACRAQSTGRLASLAHKVSATYTWDDIVLPAEQIEQLRQIGIQMRHRRTVLEQWGFDRHLAMGKGINVLFAGSSGTGKTMAAEIIAAELGLELYTVDLSALVSKYIGETEKNLEQIFNAAREANAILFFDEADAIFGKRSEVKDAHDRYANIEVGYLLQKMESYDGLIILATNLSKNLDTAFTRRLHVMVMFPFPADADRIRIWRTVFPSEAPLDADIDLEFLGRQFKLTGGNIRNIALLAAYLAAEQGSAIGMPQLVRAIQNEYQKLGKLVVEADFGPYLAHTRQSFVASRP